MTKQNDECKVKLGVVGLGHRAIGLLGTLLGMEDVEIPAICDLLEDRLQEAMDKIEESGRPRPEGYKDYKKLLTRDDIEGVIIATSWTTHVEIAIDVMKAGKYAAIEVGGAFSLEECWELVKTSEVTGMPCMMLENCCYGRNELAILSMVKKNLLGELIHCQCGYQHDIRDNVIKWGIENQHYRLQQYLNRNGDLYPTHGIGPVAMCLSINRGNRFLSLTSMSSKSRGIRSWIVDNLGEDHPMARTEVNQGDIVTTMIKCAHGETILVVHDTTLPRPYSRAGRIQGTKGLWMEDNNSIYVLGKSPEHTWESFDKYRDKYEHPLWKEYIEFGVRGGHGGMDYLCLRAFIESIREKIPTPIDVYDTASWMVITTLSEQSIAQGSSSVSFPDFTNGKWINRTPGPSSKYALDGIYEELF